MVSPINRVAHQGTRTQEVKAAAPKTEVINAKTQKTEAAAQKLAEPVRENRETQSNEVKEPSRAKAEEALRTLASQEPNPPPAKPGKSMVSADAVISAYKQ